MAPLVYKLSVFTIIVILLAAGAIDLSLYLLNRQTISQWLRDNPIWFLAPASVMLLFISVLIVHLFVFPRW